MKTFTAKPVIVPNDMAEKLDEATGQERGYLRNLIADGGNLHELDEELLAMGLMSSVKGMLEDKHLHDNLKPLSVGRLANVIYVVMFAYCSGTMHVKDDGDVLIGEGLEDVKKAMDLQTSDKVKFASGATMPTAEFFMKLKFITSQSAVEKVYGRVVKRQGLTKGVSPQDAFRVAKVAIIASKDLIAGK